MPEYDAFSLAEVTAAIQSGQPTSLGAAADGFAAVVTALTALGRDLTTRVSDVTSAESGAWEGPAANAFVSLTESFVERLGAVGAGVSPYESALDTADAALITAQNALTRYRSALATSLAGASPEAVAALTPQIDAQARAILAPLVDAYRTATAALRELAGSEPDADDTPAPPVADEGPLADESIVDLDLAGADPLLSVDTIGLLGDDVSLSGLMPVDLGGGAGLSLGAADPTTLLAGLDPLPSPSLVLGGSVPPGSHVSSPVDASLAGGGLVAPPFGRSPATHLTTAMPAASAAPAAPSTTGATRPPFLPMSPLGGGALGTMPGPLGRRIGAAPVRPAGEEEEERESTVVGDEEWDDGAGLAEAIGRDPATRTTGG